MRRRVVVLANPIAGRGRGAEIGHRALAGLTRRGFQAELQLTPGWPPGSAPVSPAPDLVVAVGGDGTIRDAFRSLPDPAIPVGIVPAGTANVLALDLGVPRDVERALDVIAAGRTSPLDVATVNGRLCVLAASAGLDAGVVHEVARRRHGPISKMAYVRAALRALRAYTPSRVSVEIDGRGEAGTYGLVIVANAINYGSAFRLCRHRRLDDGLFEIYLVRNAHLVALAAVAARGLTRGLCAGRRCEAGALPPRLESRFALRIAGGACRVRRIRQARITSPAPVACQVDGDAAGHTPLDIAVEPARHVLIVP
jgi:diacylglycerol kinase family enzyme